LAHNEILNKKRREKKGETKEFLKEKNKIKKGNMEF
jgi:hypothetical protein